MLKLTLLHKVISGAHFIKVADQKQFALMFVKMGN